MDKIDRLSMIISYYANGKSSVFATKLGITPQAISTWKARGTFDIELIFAKCEYINPEWLLSGRGDMLLGKTKQLTTTVSKPLAEYKAKVIEPLVADTPTTINTLLGIIKDKDKKIEELLREIGNLKSEIDFISGTRAGEEEVDAMNY